METATLVFGTLLGIAAILTMILAIKIEQREVLENQKAEKLGAFVSGDIKTAALAYSKTFKGVRDAGIEQKHLVFLQKLCDNYDYYELENACFREEDNGRIYVIFGKKGYIIDQDLKTIYTLPIESFKSGKDYTNKLKEQLDFYLSRKQ